MLRALSPDPDGGCVRAAIALSTLLGVCVAQPATASPDVAKADAAVRAFMAQEGIPTAHVTILRGDKVILQRGYGSVEARGPAPDAASIFPLGSISKQFTAAAIMALVDAGKVRLDARVGDYLPEWFANEPSLRVSHLLSQTSGLADFLWLEGYRPLAGRCRDADRGLCRSRGGRAAPVPTRDALVLQQLQLQSAGADRRAGGRPAI